MKKLNHLFRIFMLATLFLTAAQVRADQGYAVLSSDGKTLTFYYGTPPTTGTYYDTDNTPTNGDNYPGWNPFRTNITSVVFDSSFANARPSSCYSWFYKFTNLNSITGIEYLNTSSVTTMSLMFFDCENLQALNVTRFDTSKVTDMRLMFSNCEKLETLDVTNFNTSNVTDMDGMFSSCRSLQALNVTNFNTRKVTNMSQMFYYCENLQALNVTRFDTSKVTDMRLMFSNCKNLKSLNVTNFNTSNVTDMNSMFSYCKNLQALDVTHFDTSNVTDMGWMFSYCENLQTLDVTHFDTSNVTYMRSMFYNCKKLQTLDVTNFVTSNVTDMSLMFSNCRNLQTLDLDVTNFNTSNVTDMNGMFSFCHNLEALNVTNFNTSNVTDMNGMFSNCQNLQTLDVTNFNTSNVTDMDGMFSHCQNLQTLDVTHFVTSNVTYMSFMFSDCQNLEALNVTNFNTSKVINMTCMFRGCQNLQTLDVSHFNTSNVRGMSSMFSDCRNLQALDVSHFNTSNVTDMHDMFYNCFKLTNLTFGSLFDMGQVTSSSTMFYDCSNLRYIDFYDSHDTDAITEVNRSSGMFKSVPATTVIFLPRRSQYVTDATNVVYSYNGNGNDLRCPTYYSEDKVDIEFPRDFKANTAQYTRTMSNTYGSVILPYAFTTNENIQAYIQDKETPEIMHFKDTETVPLHTPFAFKKLADGTTADFTMTDGTGRFGITVKATRSTLPTETTWDNKAGAPYSDNHTAVKVHGWSTRGYYINQKLDDYADTYYIAGDKFYKADGQITVYPHRVSFHNPNSLAAVYNIDVEDDITTAIKEAELRKDIADAQTIYDAAGRQVSQPRKGLNIIRMADGSVKKVIIK